ncbi:MAG TPA: hypothetical protein DDZ91_10590 [Firmicutes bacterium]|nr:hypothetical protein [Bacillota bacterium]
MIAEKLRKSILQAAIQGKLTVQLPEDGDARELLAAIKAEKDQLIKEGKIKKEKPLPEITEDEVPFEIPESWCWVRLGTIGYAQTGTTPDTSRPKYYGCDIPFIKPPYIFNDRIDYEAEGLSKLGISKGRLIKKNSILMVCIGGSTGKTYYCDRDVCCNQQINTITTYSSVNMRYLHKVMQSQFFQEKLWGLATGTATTIVNKENWRQLLVPLPPLSEQNRVVKKMESILPELDKLEKDELKLDLLQKSFPKKMKDSLLQEAIQGKLTEQQESDGDARDLVAEIQKEKGHFIKEGKIKKEKPLLEITEDEIPFDIPENWCWVRLGDISDYGIGKQVNQNNIAPNSWILELEDIEKETFKLNCKRFDRKPGSSKNKFSTGEILYGKLRPYLKKVIIADESGYCSTEIIPFHGYANINSSYLKYCMVSPSVNSNINQITHGMDMPRLGTDKAKRLIIPLPPLAEQFRIVQRLEQLLPLCDALE